MSRKIANCINPTLYQMYKKTADAISMSQSIKQFLPDEFKAITSVAHFNHGKLVLSVENAAIACKLRYLLPELRTRLRCEGKFHHLSTIEVALRSIHSAKQQNVKPPEKKNQPGDKLHAQSLEQALAHLEQTIKDKQQR